ncbi:30S ribosomal protein S11 [Candidatus Microgenomates bacterium]|jgi:small subunit ribosomal protein S11|nr:MAG: 30S ribosomal protein S11 [Candidatus Microgenomates bacterium]
MNKKTATIGPKGKVNVLATFNNTVVSVSDLEGNVLLQESAGSLGFKGARKSTPYAATVTTEKALVKAKQQGIKEVEVYIKGPGAGRDAALRAIRAANLKIDLIADVTPIPHNGVKPRKPRRV